MIVKNFGCAQLYSIQLWGCEMPFKGYKQTEEHKRKLSVTLTGRTISEETRQRLRDARTKKPWTCTSYGMLNKRHSKETKRQMSIARKEYLKTNKNGMEDKHHTEEVKEKISKSNKGKHLSTTSVKHHVYLEENDDKIMKMEAGIHTKLHRFAYHYLYEKYGKKGIDDYIIWFNRTIKRII